VVEEVWNMVFGLVVDIAWMESIVFVGKVVVEKDKIVVEMENIVVDMAIENKIVDMASMVDY
jgi:hypothetical protein